MNEFTVGFEVDFGGMSERFVSEEAYKTQQKLKDDYMRRDQKHMETISELETKIANQSKEISRLLNKQEKLKAEIEHDEKIISDLNSNRAMLLKKIEELNEGIRNSEDLTWKEKYDNLKKETDDAIRALQTGRTRDGYISELENKVAKLEGKNEELKVINQTWVKEAEKYRIKFRNSERGRNKAEETLSKIHDLIHGEE